MSNIDKWEFTMACLNKTIKNPEVPKYSQTLVFLDGKKKKKEEKYTNT